MTFEVLSSSSPIAAISWTKARVPWTTAAPATTAPSWRSRSVIEATA